MDNPDRHSGFVILVRLDPAFLGTTDVGVLARGVPWHFIRAFSGPESLRLCASALKFFGFGEFSPPG